MLLHGIFPPITTPFYPDGAVYYRKLEYNVERYSRTPVAGIVVLGSTGEAVMLSDDEQRQVLRVAAETASPEKVLIAGTGQESALATLRLTEHAAWLGYDVALVRTPHYYRPQMTPESQLAFYRTVADRSPLPIMIYSVPVFTAYDLPAEVVAALAEHPNIIGIKDSSGKPEKARAMVEQTRNIKRTVTVTEAQTAVTGRMLSGKTRAGDGGEVVPVSALAGPSAPAAVETKTAAKTRGREVGFQVLVGSAQTMVPSLDAGAVGAILGFATAAPTVCFEIYIAWKDGDVALAREKQERIGKPAQRLVGELGIPALKYALDLNGYYGGPPRLPLLVPTADVKAEVERLMADIRN